MKVITEEQRRKYVKNLISLYKNGIRNFNDVNKRRYYLDKAKIVYDTLVEIAISRGAFLSQLPEYKERKEEIEKLENRILNLRKKHCTPPKPKFEELHRFNLVGDIIITDPCYFKDYYKVPECDIENTYNGEWNCDVFEADDKRNFRPIKTLNFGTFCSDSGQVCVVGINQYNTNVHQRRKIFNQFLGGRTAAVIQNFSGNIIYRLKTFYTYDVFGGLTKKQRLNIIGSGVKDGEKFSFITVER